MDGNAKQEVAEKLRSSGSVLVTVAQNPSVDQLSAALGLSLMLTKLGKHTTTVFSGEIPNTMEFLDPARTFDKTVDGLRDFIISLDKEKADKLRYKVEDNVVKIYITPYKSKISEADLEFSQGDFNVDLVVGLGVHKRTDLDDAITSHGRILHDATVITINDGNGGDSNIGSVDWTNEQASCLCEMLVSISEALQGGILDKQMSTAFLTGIVAATERFKNDKTTPKLMTMAAQLMAAGANQQLIAKNLQFPDSDGKPNQPKPKKPSDDSGGDKKKDDSAEEDVTVSIDRDKNLPVDEAKEDITDTAGEPGNDEPEAKPLDPDKAAQELLSEIEKSVHATHNTLDDDGRTQKIDGEDPAIQKLEDELAHDSTTNLIDLENKLHNGQPASHDEAQPAPGADQPQSPLGNVRGMPIRNNDEPPSMGGTFNATSQQAHESTEAELNSALNKDILTHGGIGGEPSTRGKDLQPGGDIEHNNVPSSEDLMHDLQEARRAVEEAMNESAAISGDNQPIQALNAAPIDINEDTGGTLNIGNTPPPMNLPQPTQMPQQPMQSPFNIPPQNSAQPPQQPMQQPPYQPQQPLPQNPMFNVPQQPQQPVQPSFQQGQFQPPQPGVNGNGNGNGQMPPYPPNNGQTPPPMPPNSPPPMPPFN